MRGPSEALINHSDANTGRPEGVDRRPVRGDWNLVGYRPVGRIARRSGSFKHSVSKKALASARPSALRCAQAAKSFLSVGLHSNTAATRFSRAFMSAGQGSVVGGIAGTFAPEKLAPGADVLGAGRVAGLTPPGAGLATPERTDSRTPGKVHRRSGQIFPVRGQGVEYLLNLLKGVWMV